MKKIVLIDNYDSFTYNLFQLLAQHFSGRIDVVRNDQSSVDDIAQYDGIVISPGPKRPSDAGISKAVIEHLYRTKPILGVCLGLQAMNEVFGGTTVRAPYPIHGKTSPIVANVSSRLFQGVPSQFSVARYHSLIIKPAAESILQITAHTESDMLPMAAEMKDFPCMGVQFHPESFMCEYGHEIIQNFLRFV